jgi:hypothetical protein
MKGDTVKIDWRTVKLFLDEEFAVSEVSIADSDSSKVRCTCPQFGKGGKCKHTVWVRDWMNEHDGVFSIKIPPEVDPEEELDAFDDLNKFRDFVIKYGKVEVL